MKRCQTHKATEKHKQSPNLPGFWVFRAGRKHWLHHIRKRVAGRLIYERMIIYLCRSDDSAGLSRSRRIAYYRYKIGPGCQSTAKPVRYLLWPASIAKIAKDTRNGGCCQAKASKMIHDLPYNRSSRRIGRKLAWVGSIKGSRPSGNKYIHIEEGD